MRQGIEAGMYLRQVSLRSKIAYSSLDRHNKP